MTIFMTKHLLDLSIVTWSFSLSHVLIVISDLFISIAITEIISGFDWELRIFLVISKRFVNVNNEYKQLLEEEKKVPLSKNHAHTLTFEYYLFFCPGSVQLKTKTCSVRKTIL